MFRMKESSQISLLKKLISYRSVTPHSEGAIDLISSLLSKHGFKCTKLKFSNGESVANLFAEIGQGKKNLCFAGHVDVVPPGQLQQWSCNPFKGVVKNKIMYGRGAVDMKGGIVAFLAATLQFLSTKPNADDYKISFILTGDEEWDSQKGMVKLLDWLKKKRHNITACIVGEPTSRETVGDRIKNGSRGSLLFELIVQGTQGHVAYNKQFDNPVTKLVQILHELKKTKLDKGSKFFEPSNLEVTSVDVGNVASNIIPAEARANFCIRFNDLHTPKQLINWAKQIVKRHAKHYRLDHKISGQAYIVKDKALIECIKSAVKKVQKIEPVVSCAGATSDARFIKDFCPVVEFGPLISTMHQIDEHIPLKDLFALTKIYHAVIENFFRKI